MEGVGAFPLAHADGHHLHQAGLIGAPEGGVGLDASHHDHRVGFVGVLVYPDLVAVGQEAHLHRLHAGEDGTAAVFLGDAEALQDGPLSLGGGAAVAAHGGDDEGLGAQGSDPGGQFPEDQGHIADLAAAAGHAHPHAGADAPLKFLVVQLRPQLRRRVPDAVPGEDLPDQGHAGDGGVLQNGPEAGLFFDLHELSVPFRASISARRSA